MWIREQIHGAALLDDPLLESFLTRYFPRLIRERHLEAIKAHPLRKEIITAEVVNMLLPVVGITYVHSMAGIHSTTPAAVTQAALAADLIVGGSELRAAFSPLDRSGAPTPDVPNFIDLWLEMSKSIRDAASWLLSSHGSGYSLSQLVALYREDFDTLVASAENLFVGDESRRFVARRDRFRAAGLPESSARKLAALRRALPIFEVLWSARKFGHEVQVVGRVFATVLDHLGLNSVFRYEALMDPTNKWEQEVIINSYQEIRRGISLIAGSLLARGISAPEAIAPALERAHGTAAVKATTQEIRELSLQKKPLQVAALSVIARRLHMLAA
jgi:glutamate dehydrogenase